MEITFGSRLKHAWDIFRGREPTYEYRDIGSGYTYRPDRPRFTRGNEKTTITAIYNRIAIDVASLNINHCKVDENGRFVEVINSNFNKCLNVEANIDQTGRAFMQDVVMSMLDEGCVAIVPVDTSMDPTATSAYDILSMRTGKILEWYPKHVKVRVYNDITGKREDVLLPKTIVGIVENPLFAVINEPNSTMQRLVKKLSLLDLVDEQSGAGKLDMIIQLPYVIKSENRRQQAEARRKDIESQLANSKYGIAYADGTEKIVQLNRSLDNNLLKQIDYLTNLLYSQLGITQSVLDGTANEETMINYHSRTIEPIISAIVDEMKRKFLSKTARTQLQTIKFFRDPFRLVPISSIANMADTFARNEILTSNELRQIIGMKPSNDPKADQLVNSNMPQPEGQFDTMEDETTRTNEGVDENYTNEEEIVEEEPTSFGDIPFSQL